MISSTSSRTSCSSSSEICRRLALGVQVDERLVRIREHLRPAAFAVQLDPVDQVEVTTGETLVQDAHDETLLGPRAREPAVDQGRLGQLRDQLRERPADGREQLEQLRQARHGVVGGQEVREDVAAADGSREDDSGLGGRARQVAERVRRADDLERIAGELIDLVRDRVREGGLAVAAALGEQAHVQQQRLVDRNLAALFVDEVEPLAGLVEDGAEVGADRGDEALGVPHRLRERLAVRRLLGEEAVRRDRLDTHRADDERQHERRGGVAVVDDDPEVALANGVDVDRVEQVLRVALPHPRRVRDRADGAGGDAPQLLAREVLLDLLLQARREQDPGGS